MRVIELDNFDLFTLKNLGVMFDNEGVITARALPKVPEKCKGCKIGKNPLCFKCNLKGGQ